MDIITQVTIWLLGIITIKDIIATSGIYKRKWPGAHFFYGKYDEIVLRNALMDLGFRGKEIPEVKKRLALTANELTRDINLNKENANLFLISFISKYIRKYKDTISYVKETPITSNYYINTMEASHNDLDLQLMSNLIMNLIVWDNEKNKQGLPDFFIVSKSGNPLLAYKLAAKFRKKIIIKKPNEEASYADISKEDSLSKFLTNYEGSWNIFFEQRELKNNHKLTGVVVDCNATSGKQIIDIISEFNYIIKENDLKINSINKAYTLFRADAKKTDIDSYFKDHDCEFIRYFDLNEEIKEYIYNHLEIDIEHQWDNNSKMLDYYSYSDKEKLINIQSKIEEYDLLRYIL